MRFSEVEVLPSTSSFYDEIAPFEENFDDVSLNTPPPLDDADEDVDDDNEESYWNDNEQFQQTSTSDSNVAVNDRNDDQFFNDLTTLPLNLLEGAKDSMSAIERLMLNFESSELGDFNTIAITPSETSNAIPQQSVNTSNTLPSSISEAELTATINTSGNISPTPATLTSLTKDSKRTLSVTPPKSSSFSSHTSSPSTLSNDMEDSLDLTAKLEDNSKCINMDDDSINRGEPIRTDEERKRRNRIYAKRSRDLKNQKFKESMEKNKQLEKQLESYKLENQQLKRRNQELEFQLKELLSTIQRS